jgi:hypothetical protein
MMMMMMMMDDVFFPPFAKTGKSGRDEYEIDVCKAKYRDTYT